ncbi:MAG: GNAT family N-acetyltransferase [Oscillospiraceae bacterium]|nr:GNAT family N-acetyltransferase [Oscillospiraceae bacterium]
MQIVPLSKAQYKNWALTVRYQTKGYYDFKITDASFSLQYTPFSEEREKQFSDQLFADWLEAPIALGAFENNSLLGFVEGSLEAWNNRFRISNIYVFEGQQRHGIGSKLMDTITAIAKESHARMLVLETQSCNEKAIAFYKKHGFECIGFDLYAYSNEDLERCEVRIEMGKKLQAGG